MTNHHPTSAFTLPARPRGWSHRFAKAHTAAEVLVQICRSQMSKGSLSFYTAARLLPADERHSIFLLYAWCRAMDDLIDGQNLGSPISQGLKGGAAGIQDVVLGQEKDSRSLILKHLREETDKVMKDRCLYDTMLASFLQKNSFDLKGREQTSSPQEIWPLLAMGYLAHEKGLSPFYAGELLKGMAMDLKPPYYLNLRDLEVYCYHVAGVVGVMYCDIVGLRDENAKKHAAELGIAMQLTNICRDVLDDAHIGRIYLPRVLMKQYGIPFEPQELNGYKEALFELTEELLDRADVLYARAAKGFRYLPWRAALAASAACHIYKQIGSKVRQKKSHAWDLRCRVGSLGKLAQLGRAFVQISKDAPFRFRHPWRRQLPQNLWRYEP